MIVKVAIELLCGLITVTLNGFNAVNIPVNGIQVLSSFAAYGSYVVGADLLLMFCSCVLMWMSVKLTLGLVLFVWRLLPLT